MSAVSQTRQGGYIIIASRGHYARQGIVSRDIAAKLWKLVEEIRPHGPTFDVLNMPVKERRDFVQPRPGFASVAITKLVGPKYVQAVGEEPPKDVSAIAMFVKDEPFSDTGPNRTVSAEVAKRVEAGRRLGQTMQSNRLRMNVPGFEMVCTISQGQKFTTQCVPSQVPGRQPCIALLG